MICWEETGQCPRKVHNHPQVAVRLSSEIPHRMVHYDNTLIGLNKVNVTVKYEPEGEKQLRF